MVQNNYVWGYHLLLDCWKGDIAKITDKENIKNFVSTLVDEIKMKAYGPTFCEHFATHDPEKAGFSMFQMIETSNISGHFVDKNGDFYIDVFSCMEFDQKKVVTVVNNFFKPEKVIVKFCERVGNPTNVV